MKIMWIFVCLLLVLNYYFFKSSFHFWHRLKKKNVFIYVEQTFDDVPLI